MTSILIRTLLFIVISLSTACSTKKQETVFKNVLFIGNSLTYYHDMPGMLGEMIKEKELAFNIQQSTYPGYSLYGHLNYMMLNLSDSTFYTRNKEQGEETKTEKILKSDTFDIIILQDRTGQLTIERSIEEEIIPSIKEIESLLNKIIDPTILIFQNFPTNQQFPKQFCRDFKDIEYCSPKMQNLEDEMSEIRKGLKLINRESTKIGEMFYAVLKQHKEIKLYDDQTHPSKEGAFLSALTFYKSITGLNVEELKYKANIDEKVAEKLKSVVEREYR